MKVFETQEVPARPATTKEVCVGRTCDLCGARSGSGDWHEKVTDWQDYEEVETEVTYKRRTNCYDDLTVESCTIDVCPACFVKKLIPWVNSQRTGDPIACDTRYY